MTRVKHLLALVTFLVSVVVGGALMAAPSAAVVIPPPPGAELHCKAGAPTTQCTVTVNIW